MPNVFVLKDHLKERKDFNVEIAGKVYTIPHIKKFGRDELAELSKAQKGDYDAMYGLMGLYIGQNVANGLSYEELEALYQGWSDFIKETEGTTLGE